MHYAAGIYEAFLFLCFGENMYKQGEQYTVGGRDDGKTTSDIRQLSLISLDVCREVMCRRRRVLCAALACRIRLYLFFPLCSFQGDIRGGQLPDADVPPPLRGLQTPAELSAGLQRDGGGGGGGGGQGARGGGR